MKKQTKVKPNVPKKKVKPKKSPSIEGIRADYLFNRECMLEDFANALEEVRRDVPSLPGNIAGMDYKQVSTRSIFLMIKGHTRRIINRHTLTLPKRPLSSPIWSRERRPCSRTTTCGMNRLRYETTLLPHHRDNTSL